MIVNNEQQIGSSKSMTSYLSPLVQDIKPSGIRKFFDLVSASKDIITLGVGEPDFITPWHVREACVYSLERGYTRYTSNAGMPELREAISGYLKMNLKPHTILKTRFWLLSAVVKRSI